jgi:hypothetical protein
MAQSLPEGRVRKMKLLFDLRNSVPVNQRFFQFLETIVTETALFIRFCFEKKSFFDFFGTYVRFCSVKSQKTSNLGTQFRIWRKKTIFRKYIAGATCLLSQAAYSGVRGMFSSCRHMADVIELWIFADILPTDIHGTRPV